MKETLLIIKLYILFSFKNFFRLKYMLFKASILLMDALVYCTIELGYWYNGLGGVICEVRRF